MYSSGRTCLVALAGLWQIDARPLSGRRIKWLVQKRLWIAEKARETLSVMGVPDVTTEVVDGDPAGNIIAAAEHEKAELVVMGRRGMGNVAGLVMGSVSHKVAHPAECACLTVK